MHLPRPLLRAVTVLRNHRAHPITPENRGHLLWVLDTPAYRRALPDVPGRIALARAIRDREEAYVSAVGRWLRRGQDLHLLALAVRAGVDAEEIHDHLDHVSRLRRARLRRRVPGTDG
jgi:hypothetical protein